MKCAPACEINKDCYTLMKEACDSGYCWEIISNKDAMKINSVIGTMAAMIALMILVMITTLVVYFRFPPKNSVSSRM
ncbi:hypothetical protein E2C01_044064 [Portunus trituberculatus]|uniref:Uncharacterized protein n=1 Tax=Portunus trituberculatus TaxID=210409 RepID=A0A5B7FR28_PORTR|nr:hypothetical protein [Portunus trituberculatus]